MIRITELENGWRCECGMEFMDKDYGYHIRRTSHYSAYWNALNHRCRSIKEVQA
jgi:hypothetical protein